MGFPVDVRTKVLIRCARICCLCFKQCGTKIEIHHIVQEADGGANTESNALPVCFDCHAEVGNYNARHPKGTKYRAEELRVRRDMLYKLVESGTLIAQVLVKQLPGNAVVKSAAMVVGAINALPSPPEPSGESREFLERVLKPTTALDALPRKLEILGAEDSAWILDSLVDRSKDSSRAIEVLAQLAPGLPRDQKLLTVERTVRNVTLFGDIAQKAALLSEFDSELLQLPDKAVRMAFFNEVFDIIKRDQFVEVNDLVPVLVGTHSALPKSLWANYVMLLINQSVSMSYKGAPAARQALTRLPDEVAKAGLLNLKPEVVIQFGHDRWQVAKRFANRYGHLVGDQQGEFVNDVATMSSRAFFAKYIPD
ncbi:HNH endonuclease [Burkholderia stagnalis]|uniref:HNH endonuclease n=1 Tax=Burkholderia stagnalis TaxID=1503054 RepID=UPI000F59A874|nr:HNH endonuclease [Burkholderia stagnalis]RQQ11194.1 HNH endonuclease [Burkholderia stagnalis]RQR00549.1 HNH endonuclease [Burkholderia stagnalis]RQX89771.1 HNH endonuclease [Burkholderia stagnalis]RQY79343.1 HNH endonuclease [Burkholderia stagnalis]